LSLSLHRWAETRQQSRPDMLRWVTFDPCTLQTTHFSVHAGALSYAWLLMRYPAINLLLSPWLHESMQQPAITVRNRGDGNILHGNMPSLFCISGFLSSLIQRRSCALLRFYTMTSLGLFHLSCLRACVCVLLSCHLAGSKEKVAVKATLLPSPQPPGSILKWGQMTLEPRVLFCLSLLSSSLLFLAWALWTFTATVVRFDYREATDVEEASCLL